MNKPKIILNLIVLLLFILIAGDAFSFEVNGLQSGMAEESIIQILVKRGFSINKIEPDNDETTSYLAIRKDSKLIEAVSFHNGKLMAYQYDVAGGIVAFIRMVEKKSLIRGKGAYKASSSETPAGQWNSISIFWIEKNEKFEISYSLVNEDEQVFIRYEILN